MFCAQCGQRVAEGSKFCNNCGAAVVAAPPPAAPVPPAPQPARATPAAAPAPAAHSASPPPGSAGPNFDSTKAAADASQLAQGIFTRVRNILMTPSTEWPVIAAEPSSTGAIYLRYVAPLVAIGVIATFIGQTMIGTSAGLLGLVRVGMVAGLAHAIVMFGLAFVQIFLISWLVDVLAPTFGGQRNPLAALKVTAYSFTPGWVAAVLNIIPLLGIIGIVAALYGLYLLYLGLPVLMRNPREKSIGYTVVLVLCAIVLSVIVTALSSCVVAGLSFVGAGAMSRHGGATESVTAKTDTAGVLANIFGGKSEADRDRVSQAMKTLQRIGDQAQQADKAGASNPQASVANAAAAMNAVGQIIAGGKDVQPVDFRELKAMLPTSLPGMQRTEASGESGEAMGVKGSNATARYSDGANASIRIEITDLGSMSGLAALAGKFDPNMERETDNGYERTKRVDGQLVHERYDRRARSGEVSVLVGSRFTVAVEGSDVEPATLSSTLKSIDLSRLNAITMAKR